MCTNSDIKSQPMSPGQSSTPLICSISAATEVSYYAPTLLTPERLAANPFEIFPHGKKIK